MTQVDREKEIEELETKLRYIEGSSASWLQGPYGKAEWLIDEGYGNIKEFAGTIIANLQALVDHYAAEEPKSKANADMMAGVVHSINIIKKAKETFGV